MFRIERSLEIAAPITAVHAQWASFDELMRLGAAHYRHRVVRWLLAPGLALQGLTTREPDDGQIECAVAALERVLRREGGGEVGHVV